MRTCEEKGLPCLAPRLCGKKDTEPGSNFVYRHDCRGGRQYEGTTDETVIEQQEKSKI